MAHSSPHREGHLSLVAGSRDPGVVGRYRQTLRGFGEESTCISPSPVCVLVLVCACVCACVCVWVRGAHRSGGGGQEPVSSGVEGDVNHKDTDCFVH